MASSQYDPPDLASILRTLAASTSSTQTRPPSSIPAHTIAALTPGLDGVGDQDLVLDLDFDLEEGEYDPNDAILPISCHERGSAENTVHPITPPPTSTSLLATAPHRASRPPSTDPRAITTFGAALRHITNIVARNEAIVSRIRKLIESQHQHERQWWEAREALVKKQGEREEGRRKVDEVLKSMGGKVSTPVSGATPEDDAAELLRYDRKVHRACMDMVNATEAELQAMGVPFFGTRSELIVSENGTGGKSDDRARKSGGTMKLSRKELIDLQKKVLGLLQDLCQD